MGGSRNMVMKYCERLLLWESGYGRELGWDVEIDGKAVARLSRPVEEDMFWVSYEVEAVAEDSVIPIGLLETSFWIESGTRLVFRNKRLKGVVAACAVAGRIDAENRRITFRGLYADVAGPGFRFVLMFRWLGRGMIGRSM